MLADGKVNPLPGANTAVNFGDALWEKGRHDLAAARSRAAFLGEMAALGASDAEYVLRGTGSGTRIVRVGFPLEDVNLEQFGTNETMKGVEVLAVAGMGQPQAFVKHGKG